MTTLAHILGVTLAMMLDPVLIFLALMVGICARRWWHVILGALVAGVVTEVMVKSFGISRLGLRAELFVFRCLAAVLLSTVCYGLVAAIRQAFKTTKDLNEDPPDLPAARAALMANREAGKRAFLKGQ